MDLPTRKDRVHKPKLLRFGNITETRAVGNQILTIRRKDGRSKLYDLHRNLPTMEADEIPSSGVNKLTTKPDHRRKRLVEWKRERELKEAQMKQQRKPQFKVGIVHHHIASPFRDVSNATTIAARSVTKVDLAAKPKCMTRAVTRAQQYHQTNDAIIAFPFKGDKFKPFRFNPSLTIPNSPRFMERERQKISTLKKARENLDVLKENGAVSSKCPLIVPQHLTSSPEPLAQPLSPEWETAQAIVAGDGDGASESQDSDEMLLRPGSAKHQIQDNANRVESPFGDNTMLTAIGKKSAELGESGESMDLRQLVLSPFVETERGNHRRRLTNSNGRSPMRMCVLSSYSSVTSPSQSQLHRQKLESETARLLVECDRWCNLTKNRGDLPAEVVGEIDSVTGQTRLLTRDKFAQFRTLIDRCETPDSQQVVVTTGDLDGFWDAMYLQVVQLDKRFAMLEELKANNWVKRTAVDESTALVPKKLKFMHGTRVKQASKPVKSSGIRQLLQQARIKMKSGSSSEEPLLLVSGGSAEKVNTFNGVFFKVQSPQASTSNTTVTDTTTKCLTAETTPTSQCGATMLRQVLSCEAYRRRLNASGGPHKLNASGGLRKLTSLHSVFIAKTISSPLVNVHSDDSFMTPKSILKRKINGPIENQSEEELIPAHVKTVLFKDCADKQPNLMLNISDGSDDVFCSARNSQTNASFQTLSPTIGTLTQPKEESEKPKPSKEKCETLIQSNEVALTVKQQTVQEPVTPRLTRLSTMKRRMSHMETAEISGSFSGTPEIRKNKKTSSTLLQLTEVAQTVEKQNVQEPVTTRLVRLSTMKKRMSYMETAEISSSSSVMPEIAKDKNTSATLIQLTEVPQTLPQQSVQELVTPRLTRLSTLRQRTPYPSPSPVVSPNPVSANYKGTPRPKVKSVSSILRPSILDATVLNTFTVPKISKRSRKARRYQSGSKTVDERQEGKCDLSPGQAERMETASRV